MKKISVFVLLIFYHSVALAQQPGLDPTFGNQGIVIATDAPQESNGGFGGIAMLPDGKFIVAGDSLNRYNSDGTPDISFGNNGATNYFYGTNIVLQPDGKILAAGGSHFSPQGGGMCRLTSNGQLDNGFGTNGKVSPDDSTDIKDILLQPDGKVILLGSNGQKKYFAIFRYLPDGTLDNSFGSNGKVFKQYEPFPTDGMTLIGGALTSEGKIVIGGDCLSATNTPDSFFAMRFMQDGIIDTSFNHRGMAAVGDLWPCGAVAIQNDGKILLAGHKIFGAAVPFTLARLNSDGSIDDSFGQAGIAQYEWQSGQENKVRDMKVQPDGKIILAGMVGSNNELKYNFALLRYLPNGQLDNGFGNNGSLQTHIREDWDEIKEIALQSDGKIIAVGVTERPNCSNCNDGAMARYMSDGQTAIHQTAMLHNNISVYPNPASDVLYIKYDGLVKAKFIGLYNANGQLIKRYNSTSQEVDIKGLSQGLYFLGIGIDDTTIVYKTFTIKAR